MNLTSEKYSAKFIPDEDGDWELGLNITGHGTLFIDKKLIVQYVPKFISDTDVFSNTEVKGIAKGLKAGQEYALEIRIANEAFATQPIPFPCWGVIRAGGIRVVEPDIAIQEAVHVARESDGMISIP